MMLQQSLLTISQLYFIDYVCSTVFIDVCSIGGAKTCSSVSHIQSCVACPGSNTQRFQQQSASSLEWEPLLPSSFISL
jgi:hypothetical protein